MCAVQDIDARPAISAASDWLQRSTATLICLSVCTPIRLLLPCPVSPANGTPSSTRSVDARPGIAAKGKAQTAARVGNRDKRKRRGTTERESQRGVEDDVVLGLQICTEGTKESADCSGLLLVPAVLSRTGDDVEGFVLHLLLGGLDQVDVEKVAAAGVGNHAFDDVDVSLETVDVRAGEVGTPVLEGLLGVKADQLEIVHVLQVADSLLVLLRRLLALLD